MRTTNEVQETRTVKTKRNLQTELVHAGWRKADVGYSSHLNYNQYFDLYIRERNLATLLMEKGISGEKIEKSPIPYEVADSLKPSKNQGLKAVDKLVSSATLGEGTKDSHSLTPITQFNELLPEIISFKQYPSLALFKGHSPSLVIGFNTTYEYTVNDDMDSNSKTEIRKFISYQFSCVCGMNLIEFVFLQKQSDNLWLELALGRILDELKVRSIDTRLLPRDKDNNIIWKDVKNISVTLLCHAGKGDICAFDENSEYRKNDYLKYCSEIQGGIVSLNKIYIHASSVKHRYAVSHHTHKYNIDLTVRDTLCHVPGDKKTISELGKAISWKPIELDDSIKRNMREFLGDNPVEFMEYASTNSVVTLLFASALYGYNKMIPVTLTSCASKTAYNIISQSLGCKNKGDYERKYRGHEWIDKGLEFEENGKSKQKNRERKAISRKAELISRASIDAYHGGYNGCSGVRFINKTTFDVDLISAYPLAMSMVPNINWEDPIKYTIRDRELQEKDFFMSEFGMINPLCPMVGYVKFEFPHGVTPCIPVYDDGSIIFPRTSEGISEICVAGPDLYLALQLNAKIWVDELYVLNCLHDEENGELIYSLREIVYQLVRDRAKAKEEFGSGSLIELILKTATNCLYGKISQNLHPKRYYSAYDGETKEGDWSAITNPVSAMMITSIVRAVLLAAENQGKASGHEVYSVTTDGFITDMTLEEVQNLDLYGFRECMESGRLFLTDNKDKQIFSLKHVQDDLLSFSTRGNVSLREKNINPLYYKGEAYSGVCAHCNAKSIYESDSLEDRAWLMKAVLGRSGPIVCKEQRWTEFKKIVNGIPYSAKETSLSHSMDYDLKRKPIEESFKTEVIEMDGQTYEIATFDTQPYENIEESRRYRQLKKNSKCLRTMKEWQIFFVKADMEDTKMEITDLDWEILVTCIRGHRLGNWTIPMLDKLKGKERLEWINSFNTSNRKFTNDSWKNCGRPERKQKMIPKCRYEEKLLEMMCNGEKKKVD